MKVPVLTTLPSAFSTLTVITEVPAATCVTLTLFPESTTAFTLVDSAEITSRVSPVASATVVFESVSLTAANVTLPSAGVIATTTALLYFVTAASKSAFASVNCFNVAVAGLTAFAVVIAVVKAALEPSTLLPTALPSVAGAAAVVSAVAIEVFKAVFAASSVVAAPFESNSTEVASILAMILPAKSSTKRGLVTSTVAATKLFSRVKIRVLLVASVVSTSTLSTLTLLPDDFRPSFTMKSDSGLPPAVSLTASLKVILI